MIEIEDGKLSNFHPQKNNANDHTQRGLKALSDAYSEVGYVAPMTAAANGEMLDGNARLEQAFDQFDDEALVIRHDGQRPIIMIREDVGNADVPKAKRISYGANRIGEIDLVWNPDQLLADKEAGIDFSGLFYENEIDEILVDLEKDDPLLDPPELLIDKAQELQEKWQCESGQIWQIESANNPGHYHRLVCGDCRDMATVEVVLDGSKVNGIFTSPPYAMQRAKQYGGIEVDDYVLWWEKVQANMGYCLAEDGSFFVNIKPHCKDGQRVLYVFDLVLAMVRRWGWRFVDELCWRNSKNGVPGTWPNRLKNAFESIFHFSLSKNIKFIPKQAGKITDGAFNYSPLNQKSTTDTPFTGGYKHLGYHEGIVLPSNVIECGTEGQGIHQAPFPLKLPTFFILAYSDKTDIWLDPFAGSGTVGCAAENEGRLSMMVEKLPKYCSVILQRMKDIGLDPVLVENISA